MYKYYGVGMGVDTFPAYFGDIITVALPEFEGNWGVCRVEVQFIYVAYGDIIIKIVADSDGVSRIHSVTARLFREFSFVLELLDPEGECIQRWNSVMADVAIQIQENMNVPK